MNNIIESWKGYKCYNFDLGKDVRGWSTFQGENHNGNDIKCTAHFINKLFFTLKGDEK